MDKYAAVVTCKCIACGAKKEVGANEIPPDEMPMCDVCFSPMVAESAVAARPKARKAR